DGFGQALLVLWLVAQINPGIPLFAVTFDVEQAQGGVVALVASAPDTAAKVIEAAESALQLLGVGLFLTLLLRERRFTGGALLLLVGGALVAKGIAAVLVLRPAGWGNLRKPGRS